MIERSRPTQVAGRLEVPVLARRLAQNTGKALVKLLAYRPQVSPCKQGAGAA
jgi:hypothetical protein